MIYQIIGIFRFLYNIHIYIEQNETEIDFLSGHRTDHRGESLQTAVLNGPSLDQFLLTGVDACGK